MKVDVIEINTSNDVGLPLDPETFARVVLDFLGRKENLTYKSHSNFVITLEDINQFNHIINSKMSYHKNIVLDYFAINFGYSDGTFREISGSDALDKFLETRSPDVVSVNLNWKIIIKFDHSPTVETQEINLLFSTNLDLDVLDKDCSYIILSINHTNQSWALDILNAFKDKINEVKIEQPKIKKGYNKFKDSPVYFLTTMMIFLLLTFGLVFPISQTNQQRLRQDLIQFTLKQDHKDEVSKILSLLNVTSLDEDEIKDLKKNNKEIQKIISNKNKETIIQLILITLLTLFPFGIRRYIEYSVKYFSHKSFIVVSNIGYSKLEKYRDAKSKINYIGFTIVMSTIMLSIISAIIFKIIEKFIF